MKKGFVLGKFMPPHLGHMHLIQTAAAQVDELTVMVCSIKSEPIAGALRYHWMKELFPKLRVLHITDENPQEPSEHRFFWQIWVDTVQRNMPDGVEVFFSSENYGEEFSLRLGIEHVMVDLDRKTVPISASKIRANPYTHWQFIPEVVRPYYIKRVVLTGPESTGKSVLSQQLAQYFQTNFVEEYGRTYVEKHGLDCDMLDLTHIAAGQLMYEDLAARKANRVLFCDTDLIVTQIWSEIFLNHHCPQWIIEVNHQRHYDLFLLMDVDIPWVDDGTREFSAIRQQHFFRIKEELESRNLPYVVISGNFKERFENAVKAVERLF